MLCSLGNADEMSSLEGKVIITEVWQKARFICLFYLGVSMPLFLLNTPRTRDTGRVRKTAENKPSLSHWSEKIFRYLWSVWEYTILKNIAGVDWGSLLWFCTKSPGDTCSMWLSLSHLLLRLQSLCSSKMKFPLGCLKRLKSTKQAGLDILSWGELCSQETPCNCTQPVLVFVLLQWCVSVF